MLPSHKTIILQVLGLLILNLSCFAQNQNDLPNEKEIINLLSYFKNCSRQKINQNFDLSIGRNAYKKSFSYCRSIKLTESQEEFDIYKITFDFESKSEYNNFTNKFNAIFNKALAESSFSLIKSNSDFVDEEYFTNHSECRFKASKDIIINHIYSGTNKENKKIIIYLHQYSLNRINDIPNKHRLEIFIRRPYLLNNYSSFYVFDQKGRKFQCIIDGILNNNDSTQQGYSYRKNFKNHSSQDTLNLVFIFENNDSNIIYKIKMNENCQSLRKKLIIKGDIIEETLE